MTFSFCASTHEYITEDGVVRPHVTGMLEDAGLVDSRWYTPESRDRGTAVHRLTADYDLGAIADPKAESGQYKGWLLGHVQAVAIIRPRWLHIEEPMMHPQHLYGCRIDRVGEFYRMLGVMEIKSGAFEKAHLVQTALQAMVAEHHVGIPAECQFRGGLYLKGNGKWKFERFDDRRDAARDFDQAREIVRMCCH